ncbi:hypothetical protein CEXT_522433 [Caerostris extrusa]|uniref:Ankyrin repeat domain-containing protein 54 n=1 Tax=Caerostris extrusa TaxID=172846 RepID=A0AAV4Q9S2_CAEEX|nr:hypothetical protein CEXT_522433 [Caerostris extrusa]
MGAKIDHDENYFLKTYRENSLFISTTNSANVINTTSSIWWSRIFNKRRDPVSNNLELVNIFFGMAINVKNFNGDTFVHLAALYGCVGVLKYYYDFKKDIFECRNRDGKTALHIAAQSSQLECVQYLLSCNVCVNALKRSDWTPLMLFVHNLM